MRQGKMVGVDKCRGCVGGDRGADKAEDDVEQGQGVLQKKGAKGLSGGVIDEERMADRMGCSGKQGLF